MRTLTRRAPVRSLATASGALLAVLPAGNASAAVPAGHPPGPAPDRVTRSTTTDPGDTRGPLDIAAVKDRISIHDQTHVRIAFGIRTYHPFRTRALNRRHRNFTIELGTDSVPGASHNISVYARRGRLRADLISNATRKRVARLNIRRTGPRSIRVRGPRRLIGARRYFVVSTYENPVTAPCGKVGGTTITCGDDVPRRGWLRLDHPAWPRASRAS